MAATVIVFQFADMFQLLSLILLILVISSWIASIYFMKKQQKKLKKLEQIINESKIQNIYSKH